MDKKKKVLVHCLYTPGSPSLWPSGYLATSAEAPMNLRKGLLKLTVPCSLLVSQDPYPELKFQANNAQERGN